jgi:DNA-binding response OmpR family regulator
MKLLLVEDNTKLAHNIKQGLVQEGYVVDLVEDGTLAQSRLMMNRTEYDLVILDRLLPSKDGVAICLAWRAEGITVPILMLTALDAVGDKVTGLNAGADDYLAKPFAFEELLARINALLRRPQDMVPDSITAHGIELSSASRTVTYKGKLLSLTLKEFMVLEYLLKNINTVITRDELYSHAWDYADLSMSNTVDVHIKNLRKKIKDNGTIIQTIRGVGYKLEA